MGGGAIAETVGIGTEGNGVAPELGIPSFCAPAEPTGRFMEMTCVYGLGLLEGAGWKGAGSLTGRLNAFVAPSEGVTFGATGCFSSKGFGSGGIEKTGGAGSGTMAGVGTIVLAEMNTMGALATTDGAAAAACTPSGPVWTAVTA